MVGERKVSRPRNRSEGVLGLEQGSYAVKRGLLAYEMGAKQLPQVVLHKAKIQNGW